MTLAKIRTCLALTVAEEIRSRALSAVILFSAVSIYLGFVLTRLAVGFEARFFKDISFVLMEIFGLLLVFIMGYRVARQDVGKGSHFELFLIRGVKPWQYLLGRYLGVTAVVGGALSVMLGVFLAINASRGFPMEGVFFLNFGFLFLRLMIMAAFVFLAAIVTNSQANFFVTSLLIYVSGYAAEPLRDLIAVTGKESFALNFLVKPLTYLMPNFSNLSAGRELSHFFGALTYALFFSSLVLTLACLSFKREE